MILETTFLIDLERESLRSEPGPAHRFLAAHPREHLYITPTIAGELASGPRVDDRHRWQDFTSGFRVLAIDQNVCWEYGRAYRFLSKNGLLIGTNDLWIAATALAHHQPLVTRNRRHYQRVPELELLEY